MKTNFNPKQTPDEDGPTSHKLATTLYFTWMDTAIPALEGTEPCEGSHSDPPAVRCVHCAESIFVPPPTVCARLCSTCSLQATPPPLRVPSGLICSPAPDP